MGYRYISADNHLEIVQVPKDTFVSRVPAKFRDAAPQVVETDGGTKWTVEGRLRGPAADGNDREKLVARYTNLGVDMPGDSLGADPDVLLEHMDISDVYAGVFFGATRKWDFKDPGLEKAVYRAYNDYVVELNSADPDRLIVLPWLNANHPETCAPELLRLAALGVKAVEFSVSDAGVPVFSPDWEPLWAAAEDAGIPLCTHVGDAAGTPYPPNEFGQSLAHFAQVPFIPMGRHVAQLVFSGMFERHPKLHFTVGECRIGWLPFLFQWMVRCQNDRLPDGTFPLPHKPTDYITRNMSFTFEEDYVGMKMIDDPELWLDKTAMWGNDYPHPQGTWPDITPSLDKMFEHVHPALKQELVWSRAQRIFKIKGPDAGTLDRTEEAKAKLRTIESNRARFGGRVSAGVGDIV